MADNELKAGEELLGPDRARQLLDTIIPNRDIRPAKVKRYARDMQANRWRRTGEAIKLTEDGRLVDGEHRCRAIIQSGCTIRTLVVYGVEEDARIAMDTGAVRTLADHLKMSGEKYWTNLAAALNALHSDLRGNFIRRAEPSHQELLATLEQHPHIRDSVVATYTPAIRLRIPHGVAASLHYRTVAISPDDAALFWDRLLSGENLTAGDPILVVRRKLEDNARTVRIKRLPRTYVQAYLTKAWNAYRRGEEMSHLRWNPGGAKPEPFPELV